MNLIGAVPITLTRLPDACVQPTPAAPLLEILFIRTFKTAINEFVVVPQHYEFQDSY